MVCLLHHGEGREIRGWIIATDLADLRRHLQGRAQFAFPAPQGQRELLGGRFSILFD